MAKKKFCVDCGNQGTVERKRCRPCVLIFNSKRAKEYYKKHGRFNYGKSICPICNKSMTMWRKEQASHISCRPKTIEDYNKVGRSVTGSTKANAIVRSLGIEIPKGNVIHHLDLNPENNDLNNLMLMTNSSHLGLHRKLQYHRSLWLKNQSMNSENCWNILRDQITTAWLETTSANVLKISDIGQSAGEPL